MVSDTLNDVSGPVKDYLEQNIPVLKNETRRHVLGYLGDHEEANLDELVTELSGDLEKDYELLEVQLYHTDLPKLHEEGLAFYDRDGYVELTEEGREVTEWLRELGLF